MRDEDISPFCQDDFHTDDEENRAETVCEEESDTDSEKSGPLDSASASNICTDNLPSWPKSFRESMDMLGSVTGVSSFHNRYDASEPSLKIPLLALQSSDSGQVLDTSPPATEALEPKASITESQVQVNRISFLQAAFNGINVLCGIGLLTTPYAVKEGGWLSLSILALFGIICCYTGSLLKKCSDSSPGLQSYPDIGQAAFGVGGRIVVSITLYLELYAACVEFIIMMSDNLSTLFPNAHLHFAGIHLDSHRVFFFIATIIVLPTVWLRDLTLLSYLSVGGVGASVLVALCLLWVGAVDGIGFHPYGTALDLANLPVAVGIYGFGFAGHAVFPSIYTSMEEPAKFSSVLFISFIFCWLMYTGVATSGFLIFGDAVESQFTLNMPSKFIASRIAAWTAIVNPMTKYALTMTPIALSLEELMPSGRLRFLTMSIITRTMLVISTLVVALAVPFFGFVMALIGSLLAMLVAVVFPCLCFLRILHNSISKLQIAACVVTICIGLLNACIGTYSSVKRIAEQYS